jgi:hypothetical protein
MRKYRNVEFHKEGYEVIKEHFMDDERYEISPYITRFTVFLGGENNPGILWDNINEITWTIILNILNVDVDPNIL